LSISTPLTKALTKRLFLLLFLCIACHSIPAQENPTTPPAPPTQTAPTGLPPDRSPVETETPPPDTKIQSLLRAADQATRNRDYSTCAQLLEQVVFINPNTRNAWNYLGWTYNALGQYTKAEAALRQAVAVNPADPQAYNNLGQALAYQKRYDEAIPQYLKQIEIRPSDPWAHSNLARMYLLTNQHQKAIDELQIAANITPDDASIPFNLGRAYAKTNEPEKATKAFVKSAELQPVPFRWNNVAYEMALAKLDLPQAAKYAELAIAATVQQMRDTSLDHVTREDTFLASQIASYWDTWGWIQFQQGNFKEAERYVKSSWLIHSLSVNGDHLGQIFERQGRKAEAIRMYQMALASASPAPETRDRLLALTGPDGKIDAMTEEGRALLKESQTIVVKNSHQVEGFAEFWVLLSPGPSVRGVKFANGDEELTSFEKDLASVAYPDSFPEATEIKILRRARLSCANSLPDCKLLMISSQSVPTADLQSSTPSVAGSIGPIARIKLGGNFAAAKIIKKVQPEYPPLARSTRIQGAVQLHAIIGKDGAVKQLQVISGHPLLVQAALDAVKQWTYQPTIIMGQPVELDTEIDVFFELDPRPQ
jgi:TonB family protein